MGCKHNFRLWHNVLLLSVVLLVACSGLRFEMPVPDWVLNPPKDSTEWLWGVGDGDDLESARQAALRDIASRLRVSISGSMESQMTVFNQTVDRAARNRISEVVQKTEFTNVSLEKTALARGERYALVKVDRQAFIRETRVKFDSYNQKITDAIRNLNSRTALEQFMVMRRAQPEIENAIAAAQLLRVVNTTGFDLENALSGLEALQKKAMTSANQLEFSLQYKAADADIAQVLTTYLNSNGVRISAPNATPLLISIQATGREQMLFGNRNLRLQVILNVKDERKRNVASREFLANGNSLNTFEAARDNAMHELARMMNEAGLTGTLGLK